LPKEARRRQVPEAARPYSTVEDPNDFFLTPFEPCDGCARFDRNRE